MVTIMWGIGAACHMYKARVLYTACTGTTSSRVLEKRIKKFSAVYRS
jgi:hypothetical protein